MRKKRQQSAAALEHMAFKRAEKEKRLARVVELFHKGEHIRIIAVRMGMRADRVADILRRAGIPVVLERGQGSCLAYGPPAGGQ